MTMRCLLPTAVRGAWIGVLLLIAGGSAVPAAQEPPAGPAAVQALEQALVDAIARAERSVVAIARFRIDDARGE